jgi:hypothetical protein
VYNFNAVEQFKALIKLINFEKQSSAAQAKRLAAAGGIQWNKGIYFVSIKNENQMITKKVIIN